MSKPDVPQVVQRMLADQVEREERKKKLQADIQAEQQASTVGHDERSQDPASKSLSPFKKAAISPRKFEEFWEDQVELE